jgi:2-phosphosulfolactate phosphatase
MSSSEGWFSMPRTVVIDHLPESALRYGSGWAIVAVDVIRATTTAVTAVAFGRRCFPSPSIDAALKIARGLDDPLMAGESGGDIPEGFEIDNSPSALAGRRDLQRPLVLVSSSGTRLIHSAIGSDAVYLGCFRNYLALSRYLVGRHSNIAVIGAGSKGEFREEDQACCAWIADELIRYGYAPLNAKTAVIAARWRNKSADSCGSSRSVEFLKRTGRLGDLSFIFSHLNDLPGIYTVRDGEVLMSPGEVLIRDLNQEHALTNAS